MLITEALVVGVVMVIIGLIVSFTIAPGFRVKLPEVCSSWNEKHVMEITLFFTGFLGHLFFEAVGANGWYCKHGVACSQ
jgi:hypothetical protein